MRALRFAFPVVMVLGLITAFVVPKLNAPSVKVEAARITRTASVSPSAPPSASPAPTLAPKPSVRPAPARAVAPAPTAPPAVHALGVESCIASHYGYDYRGDPRGAAYRGPKGLRLRVSYAGRSVIVTVNDYGPDASVFPERCVDLARSAFAVLADPSAGTIPVTVERLG